MDPNSLRLLMGSSGAAGAPVQQNYIEDVFSTWLYTGTGATQTITNNLDLSTKGGLTWIKSRASGQHRLTDTVRGATKSLDSTVTSAELTETTGLTAFNTTGFTIGSDTDYNNFLNYASWSFCKQAKFFDVVTFTTSSTNTNKRISHSLGSAPGLIIIKSTNTSSNWIVYHRSLGRSNYLVLNSATIAIPSTNIWGTSDPTSADFGLDETQFGAAATWVAYVFAHDAGGFGDSGNDNVISCGSVTTNGSGQIPTVNLGWEPQWLIMKNTTSAGNWDMYDTMRGWVSQDQNQFNRLSANVSSAEATGVNGLAVITSTGFRSNTLDFGASQTYIYIAIRRGPMKTPTDATKVFNATAATGSTTTFRNIGFPLDMAWATARTGDAFRVQDRLRGLPTNVNSGNILLTNSTAGEQAIQPSIFNADNLGRFDGGSLAATSAVWHHFRRAPGFFDVVAYTGTGVARTVSHNLGVVPELMIVKSRSAANWAAYDSLNGATKYLTPNDNSASATSPGMWNDSSPSATNFNVGTSSRVNALSATYIAYLFATCPGVSKVGSYTGTGTTKQIDCGFTNGARFVLIKRTDSTGDWYVWDTARGIVSGNDPFLLLNSTAAENTSTDYIDPLSTGFEISSTAPAAINANGGSYIYLAIA